MVDYLDFFKSDCRAFLDAIAADKEAPGYDVASHLIDSTDAVQTDAGVDATLDEKAEVFAVFQRTDWALMLDFGRQVKDKYKDIAIPASIFAAQRRFNHGLDTDHLLDGAELLATTAVEWADTGRRGGIGDAGASVVSIMMVALECFSFGYLQSCEEPHFSAKSASMVTKFIDSAQQIAELKPHLTEAQLARFYELVNGMGELTDPMLESKRQVLAQTG